MFMCTKLYHYRELCTITITLLSLLKFRYFLHTMFKFVITSCDFITRVVFLFCIMLTCVIDILLM